MRIKPTKDRILILTEPDRRRQTGGLVELIEGFQDFPNKGAVIAVGPDVTDLEEGDVVLFSLSAPQVRIPATDDRMLVLMREGSTELDPMATVIGYETVEG